jgi:hypothetical protein
MTLALAAGTMSPQLTRVIPWGLALLLFLLAHAALSR